MPGDRGGGLVGAVVQHLGDAEVEQLRHSRRRHQDVERLDVAVDRPGAGGRRRPRRRPGGTAGGVLDRRAAAASAYASIGSPSMYSMAKYGRPSSVRAAVEQAARCWGGRARRGSAARPGSGASTWSVSMPRLISLIATRCSNCAVGALGEVDGAHPAAADLANQPIGADPAPGGRLLVGSSPAIGQRSPGASMKPPAPVVRGEQPLHLGPQRGIVARSRVRRNARAPRASSCERAAWNSSSQPLPIASLAHRSVAVRPFDRVVEPGAGEGPLALDRGARRSCSTSAISSIVEPAEELELHHPALPLVQRREPLQRVLERDQLDVGPARRRLDQAQRHPLARCRRASGPPGRARGSPGSAASCWPRRRGTGRGSASRPGAGPPAGGRPRGPGRWAGGCGRWPRGSGSGRPGGAAPRRPPGASGRGPACRSGPSPAATG